MKLSVITICYNEKNIARTCESIMAQTNQNFEWIVIDGGSTDGTLDILNQYKSRIDIFVSEPDKGIYNAMNKGIRLAHGEYLNFMNGGDAFASPRCVAKFLSYPDAGADVIYGNMNVIADNGKEFLRTYPDNVDKLFFFNDCIGHQASFIRRTVFDEFGLYNENNKIVSDWEKWIVLAENGGYFLHWNETIANFDNAGISSVMTPAHAAERAAMLAAHFTLEEQKAAVIAADRRAFRRINVALFHYIPLLNIVAKRDGHKTVIKLFNMLPLYKIANKNNIIQHYLFGVIPILKIKEK